MNEEKVYETKLIHELEKESTSRIEACILAYSLFVIDNLFVFLADETGIRHADYGLNQIMRVHGENRCVFSILRIKYTQWQITCSIHYERKEKYRYVQN